MILDVHKLRSACGMRDVDYWQGVRWGERKGWWRRDGDLLYLDALPTSEYAARALLPERAISNVLYRLARL